MSESKRQTLEQKRAESAWFDVDKVNKSNDENLKKKYAALARRTPATIQSNGLGQTLAFLRAKAGSKRKGNEHWTIYHHISAWVMDQMGQPQKDGEALLDWAIRQDSAIYRRATTESLAYLFWLKRFAEAILPEPDSGGE